MLLEVSGLSIGIRKDGALLQAVEDTSFGIDRGEIAGLVGESGCGKTLTGLSIPGLLPRAAEITCGEVLLNGRNLQGLTEKERCSIRGKDIAMIFQEPASSLNPLQKVKHQVAETLLLHDRELAGDRRKVTAKVQDMLGRLALSDIDRIMEAYPHQLSGGICQRVMIALAVIASPQLLIADEPTTALDLSTGAQILSLLKHINQTLGTAILFISHDLRLVRHFCDKVMVMYAGRLVEEGGAEEVFTHPLHEYTKGLVGCIPSRERKGRPLAQIPGRVPSLEEGRPRGCPFAPRCAKAAPPCSAAFPPAKSGRGRRVHCLAAQLPGGPQ